MKAITIESVKAMKFSELEAFVNSDTSVKTVSDKYEALKAEKSKIEAEIATIKENPAFIAIDRLASMRKSREWHAERATLEDINALGLKEEVLKLIQARKKA